MLLPTHIANWPDLESQKNWKSGHGHNGFSVSTKQSFQNQKMDLLGQFLDTTDLWHRQHMLFKSAYGKRVS